MDNFFQLPTSLIIGKKEYEIRTDYNVILDLIIALNDEEFKKESAELYSYIQTKLTLEIMFPNYKEIPAELHHEAVEKAFKFIDMNISESKSKIKLMDWKKDFSIIAPAINNNLGYEVRNKNNYTHWWSFLGAYMEIGDSLFSTIVNIRLKKAKGKKLEKYEQEFYKENKDLIEFDTKKQRSDNERKIVNEYFFSHKKINKTTT